MRPFFYRICVKGLYNRLASNAGKVNNKNMMKIALSAVMFLLAFSPVFAQNPTVDRRPDVVTGEPVWMRALGGYITSVPSIQAGSVVVTLDGGNIRAYSLAGMPLWNFFAGGRISPFVTRSREGTSYIFRTNGTLVAVNRSGRELWRVRTGGQLSGHIVTGWDGRLFVPTENRIFCFTASGNLLWAESFEAPISISPSLDQNGGIILALENNTVLRMNHLGESYTWRLSRRPAVLLPFGQGGNSGSVPEILVIFQDGTMEIIGAADGWYIPAALGESQRVMPRLPAAPVAAASMGSDAAAVLADGRVMLVSIDKREIRWTANSHISRTVSSRNEVSITFDNWGIYVFSKCGASGFSKEGERLWATLLTNTSALPALSENGILFSGSNDWILSAHKLEDRLPAGRPSLFGPLPQGSYNTGSFPVPVIWASPPFLYNDFIMGRLNHIGRAIHSGRVGINEPEWTAWLMEVANFNPVTGGAVHDIQNRIAALRLLGQIGSGETIPWLVRLFRNETDPAVKAAAAAAIGAIGVDPHGLAMQAFMEAASHSTRLGAQYLIAVAIATAALCRFSGPPLSETGVRILTMLAANTQPPQVRRQALLELQSLRL